MTTETIPLTQGGEGSATVYASDDRKLFCRNCGRASWLHYRVIGSGLFCDPVEQPTGIAANHTQDKGA